jgi:hypothetical protein
MKKTAPKGGITKWAWFLSIAIHLIALAIFAAVKFSKSPPHTSSADTPTVTIDQIKRLTQIPRIRPKPKVKKIPLDIDRTAQKTHMRLSLPPQKLSPPLPPEPQFSKTPPPLLLPNTTPAPAPTEFFGQPTYKRKICYVVDCSGSMHGSFSTVRTQLKNSIAKLLPDQFFYIIFFRGDQLLHSGSGKLIRATPKAKAAASDFIDNARPGGTTNAINALKHAMKITDHAARPPQLIYFLTDGFDLETASADQFCDQIRNLRKQLAPNVVINTIGIMTQPQDRRILQTLAEQTGGKFINPGLPI